MRPVCPACGWVYYAKNATGAALAVIEHEQVLLVRRAHEPYKGQWMLPAGFVEYGEFAEESAVREAEEETGLRVEVTGLWGLYFGTDDPAQRRSPGGLRGATRRRDTPGGRRRRRGGIFRPRRAPRGDRVSLSPSGPGRLATSAESADRAADRRFEAGLTARREGRYVRAAAGCYKWGRRGRERHDGDELRPRPRPHLSTAGAVRGGRPDEHVPDARVADRDHRHGGAGCADRLPGAGAGRRSG